MRQFWVLVKKKINAKIDDIIEFAEIGDFIDTPGTEL